MQSKLNCEVLHDELAFEVRWAVAGESIVIQLVAKLGELYEILLFYFLFSSLKIKHSVEKKQKKLVIFYFGREIIRHQCICDFYFVNSLVFYAKFIKVFLKKKFPTDFISALYCKCHEMTLKRKRDRDDDDVVIV